MDKNIGNISHRAEKPPIANIKVIGVGNAGDNAVNHMYREGKIINTPFYSLIFKYKER